MSATFVVAAALAAAAPAPQGIPASFVCDRTTPDSAERGRSFPMSGPDYRVSGRMRLDRKADHDGYWMASGNVRFFSADGQQGVYLIVGGSSESLSDILRVQLVIRRDGKRHREYEVGLFKTGSNLRFALEVDATGAVKGSVGTRSVTAKADFQGQAVRLQFGCHRGSVSFSGISTEAAPQAE